MIDTKRFEKNPILKPDPKLPWDAYAVFNGNVVETETGYSLVYRAMSEDVEVNGNHLKLSTIGVASGKTHLDFTEDRHTLIYPQLDFERYGCEDPRVTYMFGKYYIFYTALSMYPFQPAGIRVAVAVSSDLKTIDEKHVLTPFNAKAMTMFPQKVGGKFTFLLTINPDLPPSKICIVQADSLGELLSVDFWKQSIYTFENRALHIEKEEGDHVEVGAAPIETPDGWLLIYSHIKNYFSEKDRQFTIKALLLDRDNPQLVKGYVHQPLLVPEKAYEMNGQIPRVVFPSGALVKEDRLWIYYGGADSVCCAASVDYKHVMKKLVASSVKPPPFTRFENNPILEPNEKVSWAKRAVFNPAAIELDNKIHIVYRAMGDDNTSVMGYATSNDGRTINEVHPEPIYTPREDFEIKKKENGNSGCEDPRLTVIDDRVYMTYTAYDGINIPQVALTSISTRHFAKGRFGHWEDPVIISPPGVEDKDSGIFPEKINGKYVVIHRISPNIIFDYVDSLDFTGETYLRTETIISPRGYSWDAQKIGISGPPIKTEAGWLLIYHGISAHMNVYRVGAMLLDIKDPSKIISRPDDFLIEPEKEYEKVGIVNNVVFPCGAVVRGDELFVYYGGADRVIGGGTFNLPELLNYLLAHAD